jgi:uncharacterized protein
MFFKRDLSKVLVRFSKFPVVIILGPRQSGKTTLAREFFNRHVFLNLEDQDLQQFAHDDPKRFFNEYDNKYGIIIDEFQYVPNLMSYIKILVDEKKRPGYFVLTGSQNFLVNENITQSLAGRAGIITLLPFSLNECIQSSILDYDVNEVMYKGFYPRLYSDDIAVSDFYPSYIHLYVERDVRQLINVKNLRTFQKFIRLCAGRVGQLLNVSDLAVQTGITRATAEGWLSILEASYIIFLLRPYHNNYGKRVTKSPKIYFFDTGLVCSLLGMKTKRDIEVSAFRGHIFENLIIVDLYKQCCNKGIEPPLYFWRDKNGRIEIDCLVDVVNEQVPIEIKSGETLVDHYFDGIVRWYDLVTSYDKKGIVVYGGELHQNRKKGKVISWKTSGMLMNNWF